MALASITDFEVMTGTPVGTDKLFRVGELLDMASDAVLAGAHGQTIVQGTTTMTVYPVEGVAYLPQRPVTAVAAVVADGLTLTAGTQYRFTTGGNRHAARLIRRCDGYDTLWRARELVVTYTHGWPVVPGQIRAAVCAMVKAVMEQEGGPRVTQDSRTVGPSTKSRSFDPKDAQSSTMALTGPTKSLLAELCGLRGQGSIGTPR